MRRPGAMLLGAALVAGLGAPAPAGADGARVPSVGRAAEAYSRNCQGCHGHHGVSVSEVPTLVGRVGHFAATPRGRDYLIRLPNVAYAHLDDAALAEMMNWMLAYYSAAELPDGFRAFTAEEVARLRARPLYDVLTERDTVIAGLVAEGAIASPDQLAFAPHPKR